MEWFRLGGWGMYPILIVGLISLGSAAYYAARGDARSRGMIDALSRSLVWFTATALSTDLIAVMFYMQKTDTRDGAHLKILYQGLGESLTPVVLGSAFLSLIWVLVAVGQRRSDHRA